MKQIEISREQTVKTGKTNHLKVARNLRENSSWLIDRGGGGGRDYFHEKLFANSDLAGYIIFIVLL